MHASLWQAAGAGRQEQREAAQGLCLTHGDRSDAEEGGGERSAGNNEEGASREGGRGRGGREPWCRHVTSRPRLFRMWEEREGRRRKEASLNFQPLRLPQCGN
jgi:hypothetical protein